MIRIEPRPELPKKADATKKMADTPKKAVAVDRPGFDLGGSTGKTTAGTGLGLGDDASEDPRDRSLPGRRPGDVQDTRPDEAADATKPSQSAGKPDAK